MDVIYSAEMPELPAASTYFTGEVWQIPLGAPPAPSRARLLRVRFAPGGRTNWHTHPLGQTLYVLSGVGRVQLLGQPVREIMTGDVVRIPPGEVHWHGASPHTEMVHIAMQEELDGRAADWMEPVTDADYRAAPG
jgi:quercetin dioxygenase-like cupin family protein